MIKFFIIAGAVIVMIIMAAGLMAGMYTIAVIFGEWLRRARRKKFLKLWPFHNLILVNQEKYTWIWITRDSLYLNTYTGEVLQHIKGKIGSWVRVEIK